MFFVKSTHFFVQSLRILLIVMLTLPLYNPSQIPLSVVTNDESLSSQYFTTNESPNINLLFTLSPSERNDIIKVLNLYNPSNLHLYRNFPAGFVTLQQNQLSQIKKTYPDIHSRLHLSQKEEVIPSLEHFQPKIVSKSQQSNPDSPSDIIKAEELWDKGIDGSGVKIAIIDSGIDGDPLHGDFQDRIIYAESFVSTAYGFAFNETTQDYRGHGTHVAGIAAGAGSLYKGIAYNAELLNLKVTDQSGQGTVEALLAGIDEAIEQNVDVISISLGYDDSFPWGSGDELTLAVDSAVDSGIIVVVAAGNSGSETGLASISSPASANKAITVGATNRSYNVASFSSRGPSFDYRVDPDVVAPGVDITAPLAPGCVIELAYESLENVEFDKYIAFSGTSMSTPVVSGAVALLKQQFSEATPAAIRAALQESAVDIHEPLYAQGSGLVNVAGASDLLKLSQHNGGFNLISSLPRAASNRPIEFADQIAFPGDHGQIGISFVTGTSGIISWSISSSINPFIEFNTTPFSVPSTGYFTKQLNVTIPLDTAPGNYQGDVSYTFLGQTYSIPVNFTINNPDTNVYWDTHYTGSDDSPFYNYRVLDTFLTYNSQVDINEYKNPLDWYSMSHKDILVLTDLEYPMSEKEISLITKFHEQNGSILLITSAFPYYNPDPYCKISKALGIPINFTNRIDLVNYTDTGRNREIVPFTSNDLYITMDSGNPLFAGVNKVPFSIGTAFTGNQNELKHEVNIIDSTYLIAAVYEASNKGRVLILGSEVWLETSYLKTKDGENFAKNVFNLLKPKNTIAINAKISQNVRQLEISGYYNSTDPLSVEIAFSNGSSTITDWLFYNNTLDHHRLTIGLGTIQNQRISITVKDGSIILKKFDLIDIDNLPEVIELEIDFKSSKNISKPSWADENQYDFFIDEGIDISLTHSSSSNIQSIFLVSNQPENTLNVIVPPIARMMNIVDEKQLFNNSITHQSISWLVPNSYLTGFYSYEIQIWIEIVSNFSVLLKSERGLFFIPDPEPYLDLKSTIGGYSLEYFHNIETTADIPNWNPGETIEFHLIGIDNNSHEFKIYIQFLHYYLWLAESTVLDYFEIPSSDDNKSENIGTIVLPDKTIPYIVSPLRVEIYDQLFVFLVFIRDNQGNYNIEPIFFSIDPSFDIDPLTSIVIGMIVIAILIGVVIFLRKRADSRLISYPISNIYLNSHRPPVVDQKVIPQSYCHNCGSSLIPLAKFCSICGEKTLLKDSQDKER